MLLVPAARTAKKIRTWTSDVMSLTSGLIILKSWMEVLFWNARVTKNSYFF